MDCRLEIKNRIVKDVFDNTLTKNVFTRLTDSKINVNYGNSIPSSKTKDQAFEIGLRKVDFLNKRYVSKKYGDIASLDYSTDKVYINIHPTGRLLDYYEERALAKNKVAQEQLFQLENKNQPKSNKVQKVLEQFAKNIGISIEVINDFKDRIGLDAVSVSKILEKTIYIAKGKDDITTLPEEIGHFFEQLLGENHPLHKEMMEKIISYPIYEETKKEYSSLYQDDEKKIRKEAIGKLIGENIIKQVEDINNESIKFQSWWDKVWEVISKILTGDLDFISNWRKAAYNEDYKNPFAEAAKQIVEGKIDNLNKNIDSKEEFYQLSNQKTNSEMLEASKSIFKYDLEKKAYFINGIEASKLGFERVSTKIRKRFKGATPTKEQTDIWDIMSEEGSIIHSMIEHIIKSTTSLLNGNLPLSPHIITESNGNIRNMTPKEEYLYGKLKLVFEPFAKRIFEESGIIFNEITVANSKTKTIGTIDMLVLNKDGSFDIYDFKTRGKDELSFYKRKEYDSQIKEYIKILTEGDQSLFIPKLKEVNKSRIIPITISRRKVQGVYRANDLEVLLPLPVAKEKTKIKELDHKTEILNSRLNKMFYQYDSMFQSKEKEVLAEKIKELQKTIDNIIIEKSIFEVKEQAINDLSRVNSILLDDNITFNELENIYYQTLLYKDISKGLEKDETISNIETKAKDLNETIVKLIEAKLLNVAEEQNILNKGDRTRENFFDLTDINGFLKSKLRGASFAENNLIVLLNKIINTAKNKGRLKLEDFNKKLKEETKEFLDKESNFDKLINSKTGNLYSKYKPEWYQQLSEAKKQNDVLWAKDNLTLTDKDKENYDKVKEDRKTVLNELNEDSINRLYKSAKLSKRITTEEDQLVNDLDGKRQILFNLWVREKPALLYFGSLKDEEKWKTDNYKIIEKTPHLMKFYNFWTESMREFSEITGVEFNQNFIPNIRKSTVEKGLSTGIKSFFNFDWLSSYEQEEYGVYNPITNEREYKVGLSFVRPFNIEKDKQKYIKQGKTEEEAEVLAKKDSLEDKSKDLGFMMALFASAAYNNEAMSEIQDVSDLIQITAQEATEKQVLDKDISDKDKAKIRKGTFYTDEQIRDLREVYLFNQRKKAQLPENVEKIIDKTLKGISLKVLGLNFFSPVVNAFSGTAQVFTTSAKGHYTNKQAARGYSWVTKGDKKLTAFTKLFPVLQEEFMHNDALDLSINWSKRNINADKGYFGQRIGDKLVQYGVLGAMLQSHTINELGEIVNKNKYLKQKHGYYREGITDEGSKEVLKKIDEDSKNYKSLYELYDINDKTGELEYKGDKETEPSQDNVLAFKNKVMKVNKYNIGNTDPNDLAMAKRYLLGRSLLMFRSWIQSLADERFGNKRFDDDLDQFVEGRYLTLWNIIKEEGLTTALKVQFGFAKANTIGLTEEEELNLKANLRELMLIMMAVVAMILTRIGDDDEDDGIKKYLTKTSGRLVSELTFFVNPFATFDILKTPIAASSTVGDIQNVISTSYKEMTGYITGDDKEMKDAHPQRAIRKLIPAIGQWDKLMETIDEDYNK